MAVSPDYKTYVQDLLAPTGPVEIKRMFGGAGLFRGGLMFGLIADDVLYLKTDADNRPDFDAAGSAPFTFTRGGKVMRTSYWSCPADVLEDPDAFGDWTAKAYDVALRADRAKGKKSSKRNTIPGD